MSTTHVTGLSTGLRNARQLATTRGPFSLLSMLLLALAVRRERRDLLALDERSLKDLGLSRSLAHNEAGRGFLDLPAQNPVDRRKCF